MGRRDPRGPPPPHRRAGHARHGCARRGGPTSPRRDRRGPGRDRLRGITLGRPGQGQGCHGGARGRQGAARDRQAVRESPRGRRRRARDDRRGEGRSRRSGRFAGPVHPGGAHNDVRDPGAIAGEVGGSRVTGREVRRHVGAGEHLRGSRRDGCAGLGGDVGAHVSRLVRRPGIRDEDRGAQRG